MAEKLVLELNKPAEDELLYAQAQTGTTAFGDWARYSLKSGLSLFISGNDCQEPDRMFRAAGVGVGVPFRICLRKTKAAGRYYEVQRLSDAAAPAPAQPERTTPRRTRPAAPAAKLQANLENSVPFADWSEPQLDPARYPDEHGNVARTPFDEALNRALTQSIAYVQQRKAATTPSKSTAPSAAFTSRGSAGAMTAPPAHSNRTAVAQLPGTTLTSNAMASAMIAAFDACCLFEQYAASKGVVSTFGPQDYRAVANTIYMAACEDARALRNGSPAVSDAQGAQPWRQ
jgi:hypothetical protein